jgi:hypothetical protein
MRQPSGTAKRALTSIYITARADVRWSSDQLDIPRGRRAATTHIDHEYFVLLERWSFSMELLSFLRDGLRRLTLLWVLILFQLGLPVAFGQTFGSRFSSNYTAVGLLNWRLSTETQFSDSPFRPEIRTS